MRRGAVHERPQTLLGLLQIADFAFPQFEYLPAESGEGNAVPLVPGSVGFDLRGPIGRVRLWPWCNLAQMAVPEAAVYQNGFLVPWQHDVGPAWEVFAMEPEPEPHPMQHGPDGEFGFGVFAADPAHEAGPGLWCEGVHAMRILGLLMLPCGARSPLRLPLPSPHALKRPLPIQLRCVARWAALSVLRIEPPLASRPCGSYR